MEQQNNQTEEIDHFRQVAEFTILYENLKKAEEMKIPFVIHFAQKRFDEHVLKMKTSLEILQREIAQQKKNE
jgi:hypothetical protein